jgi:hypothetical protein
MRGWHSPCPTRIYWPQKPDCYFSKNNGNEYAPKQKAKILYKACGKISVFYNLQLITSGK